MFVYWKRPVSVTSAMYSGSAISGVSVDAELAEDVAHDLARGGRVGDDEVHVAEARVVVMVVDVDRELRLQRGHRLRADAVGLRTVDGDEHAVRDVGRHVAQQAVEPHEGVLARQRRVPREVHEDVLAELAERERRREQRAESVAVGILVADDEEAVVRADRIRDRLKVSRRLGRVHR